MAALTKSKEPINEELLSRGWDKSMILHGAVHLGEPQNPYAPKPVSSSIRVGDQQTREGVHVVSCLMPTRNRLRQAQIAVDCFLRQTYANRELIIIDNSDDDRLAPWVKSLDDPRVIYVPAIGSAEPVGSLRNLAVQRAQGTHVCVWDDDDLHHPARIEAQLAVIEATDAKASMLSREFLWITSNNRVAAMQRRGQENTLLSAKSNMPAYPPLPRGSDGVAVNRLVNSVRVAYLDHPELYIYVAHGSNLWDTTHFERFWSEATLQFEGSEAWQLLQRMSRIQPIAETYDAVHGRGSWVKAGLGLES